MATKNVATQGSDAAQRDATTAPGDGPTRIEPIPPPPLAAEPAKKRRGRPPGVKNGEGGKASTPKNAVPVLNLDDVKKELAQAGALAVAFTRNESGKPDGVLGELADTLDWHKAVRVVHEGAATDAVAPSDKLEMALRLMGPYLSESGSLELAQLGPEAKFAIGAAVLVGPTVLAGFGALWAWAMNPKKAAAQVVPIVAQKTGEKKA